MEDEFKLSKKQAVSILSFLTFFIVQFVIFFLKNGVLDEMDYWAGTFGLVVFALCEVIIFMWFFGADKAFAEINTGAEIKIPILFKYIMKYITPAILTIIMLWWLVQDAIPVFFLKNVPKENIPFVIGTRIGMFLILITLFIFIHIAFKNKRK
jgi:SNF family Na+-dependent transporter